MARTVFLSWSSGKDCSMALYELLRNPEYEVAGLLTTVTLNYDGVGMHGVRRNLLRQQAKALGLHLVELNVSREASQVEYQGMLQETLRQLKSEGVDAIAVGDISMEDLRESRTHTMEQAGMEALFPLWEQDTRDLSQWFVSHGFKAVISCVDTHILNKRYSGREYDAEFLGELLPLVDPCGENGEFHTFVYDGPIFRQPVGFTRGETVWRDDRYAFCDMIL